ncbi:hypothetical protein [Parathalassolituus penaei]|uniref:Outer membrane protein beta-barrel domain-containing protein n=1 Tax=Parathalassolituus penaei TaxID=2997323 RepID=A0A9X3IT75_9GAMM|nr:hypothetical protein [Parathalassolituus penaei]MCY0965619.1 hypothetical protein [Parathalassolituus penaei]
MENPFLNRSSLVLGLFLAVAPLANAATDDSTLNNPEVLKNLLGVLGKKTSSDAAAKGQRNTYVPPTDTSALDNTKVMQSLFPLLAAQQGVGNKPDSNPEVLNDPAVMASLLGEIRKSEAVGASETDNSTSVLDDADVMASILPLLSGEAGPDSDEIFEPTPRNLGFNDTIPTRNGLIGFGLARQASTAFGEHTLVTGNARYHVSENWDALLGAEVSVDSLDNPEITDGSGTVIMSSGRTFRVFNAGLGYTLLNGLTSFDGGETYVPWKLNADAVLGQQFTGGNNGMYYGFGTSLQILKDDYWIGIDTRYFRVNDDVLNKVGTHRGLQWGLTAGFYY